jgi:hypothetical protein
MMMNRKKGPEGPESEVIYHERYTLKRLHWQQ